MKKNGGTVPAQTKLNEHEEARRCKRSLNVNGRPKVARPSPKKVN